MFYFVASRTQSCRLVGSGKAGMKSFELSQKKAALNLTLLGRSKSVRGGIPPARE
jgi:hypothetical protein